MAKAPELRPPSRDYNRVVSRFPFTETEDQAQAIAATLRDLTSGKPMDRLVCGDVGFGKTEVALRAAAAAVFAGKQVAVVAPTTVLARQLLQSFRRRIAGLGVRIETLSRLSSLADARAVRKGLAAGDVQIVIGTHAVGGKQVRFRNLGLLVIDEEQRFGARQKTRLCELEEGAFGGAPYGTANMKRKVGRGYNPEEILHRQNAFDQREAGPSRRCSVANQSTSMSMNARTLAVMCRRWG
jgi:transcription-repair coupling factor (superfamily II helicase)